MLRRLLVIALFLFSATVYAQQEAQTPELPRVLLHTAHGWAWPGETDDDCVNPANAQAVRGECGQDEGQPTALTPHYIPLMIDGELRFTIQSEFSLSRIMLQLQQATPDQPAEMLEATHEFTDVQDGDVVTWTPDLPSGDYVLSARVEWEPDGAASPAYADIFYAIHILTPEEAEAFVPEPPPMLLETAGDGRVEGLIGSYCFPAGEEGICVDNEAPPYPEAYHALPDRNLISVHLLALPYPETVTFYLQPREGGSAPTTSLEFDLVDEPLVLTWMPDAPAGDYILQMNVDWGANNDAQYYFGVTIAPPIRTDVQPPQFSLLTNENEIVSGAQGSYCWSQGGVGLCVDYMVVPPENYEPLFEGNVIYVVFQSNNWPDEVYASLFTPDMEEVLLSSQMQASEPGVYTFTLDPAEVPTGDYILIVSGFWSSGGDTSNVFGVRVFDADA